MRKVVLTVMAALALVVMVASCEKNTADNELYEQGIDNDEIKEGDV